MAEAGLSAATPFLDSYWVVPGKLLAGEYPCALQERAARFKARRLLQVGVTYIIDLTKAGEYGLKSYLPYLRAEAEAAGKAFEHCRMPIRDADVPTQGEMIAILDAIDAALEAGQLVYVHCYGGIGRTGTVIGCYLARHGMSGEEALRRIAELRAGTPDGWRPSPETPRQWDMVRGWQPGQ